MHVCVCVCVCVCCEKKKRGEEGLGLTFVRCLMETICSSSNDYNVLNNFNRFVS